MSMPYMKPLSDAQANYLRYHLTSMHLLSCEEHEALLHAIRRKVVPNKTANALIGDFNVINWIHSPEALRMEALKRVREAISMYVLEKAI